jgi:hypothetical protein
MKNAVFWDVALCKSCVNRRFEGMYRLPVQGRKIRERGTSVSRWLADLSQDLHTTTSPKTAFFNNYTHEVKNCFMKDSLIIKILVFLRTFHRSSPFLIFLNVVHVTLLLCAGCSSKNTCIYQKHIKLEMH